MSENDSDSFAETHQKIIEFVRERFPLARSMELHEETSLLDSGVIDSLGILDLLAYIEEIFDFQASEEDLVAENFDSVPALVRFVESKR